MNKKYIKENKTLVREFLGALIKAVRRKSNNLVKRLTTKTQKTKAIDDSKLESE